MKSRLGTPSEGVGVCLPDDTPRDTTTLHRTNLVNIPNYFNSSSSKLSSRVGGPLKPGRLTVNVLE